MNSSTLQCPVCGAAAASVFQPCSLCERIMLGDSFPRCRICAADLAGADNPCPDCRTRDTGLDGIASLGPWSGPLREWLSILKYGGDTRLARWLVERLVVLRERRWPGIPIVPVPPRPTTIRRRGYDAVSLLARGMRIAGVPVLYLLVRKGRKTQKGLGRQERMRGERLHFEPKPAVRLPEEVILLDDVATTGTTLEFCASALKTSGVKRIHALIVCRD